MGNEQIKKGLDIRVNSNENNAIDLKTLKKFEYKGVFCTCIIEIDSKCDFGFFCKIPIHNKKLLNVLITSHHIFSNESFTSSKDINIEINGNKKMLPKKDRKTWCNSINNYICLEILKEDNIKDFYLIDKDNINNNYKKENSDNKSIIIYSFNNKETPGLSNGLITNIKDSSFHYSCDSFLNYSGGFIINPQTNNIIGIHKEKYESLTNDKNNENKDNNINVGIFIEVIINDINNNLSNSTIKSINLLSEGNNNDGNQEGKNIKADEDEKPEENIANEKKEKEIKEIKKEKKRRRRKRRRRKRRKKRKRNNRRRKKRKRRKRNSKKKMYYLIKY